MAPHRSLRSLALLRPPDNKRRFEQLNISAFEHSTGFNILPIPPSPRLNVNSKIVNILAIEVTQGIRSVESPPPLTKKNCVKNWGRFGDLGHMILSANSWRFKYIQAGSWVDIPVWHNESRNHGVGGEWGEVQVSGGRRLQGGGRRLQGRFLRKRRTSKVASHVLVWLYFCTCFFCYTR